jgi:hypothetical protein
MSFFFGIVSMTSLQYLSTVVGLVTYGSGAASVNSLFSDCLVEGTTGFKLYNLLSVLAGTWQPFVLVEFVHSESGDVLARLAVVLAIFHNPWTV